MERIKAMFAASLSLFACSADTPYVTSGGQSVDLLAVKNEKRMREFMLGFIKGNIDFVIEALLSMKGGETRVLYVDIKEAFKKGYKSNFPDVVENMEKLLFFITRKEMVKGDVVYVYADMELLLIDDESSKIKRERLFLQVFSESKNEKSLDKPALGRTT